MTTTALVALADGTEEIEFTNIVDILRRADVSVTIASIMAQRQVTGSRDIKFTADAMIDDINPKDWDVIAVPGGLPGAEHMAANKTLINLIQQQLSADKWVAAICAAPALVLAENQLISDYSATCYPGFLPKLEGHVKSSKPKDAVVVDRNLITSQGPGTAMAFALCIVRSICGEEKYQSVKTALLA